MRLSVATPLLWGNVRLHASAWHERRSEQRPCMNPFVWPGCVFLWAEFVPPSSRRRRYALVWGHGRRHGIRQTKQTRRPYPPAVSWFTWKESFGFVSCLPSHLIREIRHLVTYKQLQYKAGLPKCSQLEIHKRIMFVCVCACVLDKERKRKIPFNPSWECLKGNSELKNV